MKNSLFPIAALFVSLHFLWNSTKNEALANDSAFSGVGGTPRLMKGEHASIAMESEKIVIVANDKFYDTRVDFVFRNDGNAASVQMGFPESGYGDVMPAQKTDFLRFATWVDGRKTSAKRIITRSGEGMPDAYWLKTVSFGPRQKRRVRVEYRSKMGGTTTWGIRRALSYPFTGQNWKGQVERSDLEIRVQKPGLWIGLPMFEGKPLEMILENGDKGAIFRKTWRNWQAQGGFTFGLTRAVPFWMLDRSLLPTIIGDPKDFNAAVTFRVGAVPDALPIGAEAPSAFRRGGVTYLSLWHLRQRLGEWTKDSDLKWDAKTRVSTLRVGQKTLQFSPNANAPKGSLPAILLRGSYDSSLYVPLAPIAKTLGLTFKLDPNGRLFDLHRGTLAGQ